MKCFYVLFLLIAYTFAQGAVILAPPPNSTLSSGQDFVVEVGRPDTLTNSQEVSVAIGLLSCAGRAPAGTCEGINTAEEFGTILFAGPYNPTAYAPGTLTLVQNYTVTIPDGLQTGGAVLSVAHFNMIGALFYPNLQVLNETVFIQ